MSFISIANPSPVGRSLRSRRFTFLLALPPKFSGGESAAKGLRPLPFRPPSLAGGGKRGVVQFRERPRWPL